MICGTAAKSLVMGEYVHWVLCKRRKGKGLASQLKKLGLDFEQDTWAWTDSNVQWGRLGCELWVLVGRNFGNCDVHMPTPHVNIIVSFPLASKLSCIRCWAKARIWMLAEGELTCCYSAPCCDLWPPAFMPTLSGFWPLWSLSRRRRSQ